jgi:hypothetical protein
VGTFRATEFFMLAALLVSVAFAEEPRVGSGTVRLGAGAGVSEVGASGRVSGEGEVWVMKRLGVGLRAVGGIDGLDTGRTLLVVEPTLPIRVIGGQDLALILTPGIGIASVNSYVAKAELDENYDTDVSTDSQYEGVAMSASVFGGLYGRMGFLAMTAGPRYEVYNFKDQAVTLNLAVGVGW